MYTALIAFFFVAISASFLCSLWEAVLLSITPSYAQIKLKEGHPVGRQLSTFKANIDRPLAAILTLNTVAHTVGAIGVGSQSVEIWAETSPWITGVAIPAGMTLAILVLSEIIPKTIGAVYWKEFVPFTVASLSIILWLMAPLVWLSQAITHFVRQKDSRSILSRSDFLALAEIGEKEGVIEQKESEIIRKLLRFNQVRAMDVMTPREHVHLAPESLKISNYVESAENLRYSRVPTCIPDPAGKDKVIVTGYVLKDDVLATAIKGKSIADLRMLRRDLISVDEDFPIPRLFNRFLEQREHMALVVDAEGAMSGIVTMEDVIETLLGLDIADETDRETDLAALARKNREERANRAEARVWMGPGNQLPENPPAEKPEQ